MFSNYLCKSTCAVSLYFQTCCTECHLRTMAAPDNTVRKLPEKTRRASPAWAPSLSLLPPPLFAPPYRLLKSVAKAVAQWLAWRVSPWKVGGLAFVPSADEVASAININTFCNYSNGTQRILACRRSTKAMTCFERHVYVACLYSTAEEEADRKQAALVCVSKSVAEPTAYLWPTCGLIWDTLALALVALSWGDLSLPCVGMMCWRESIRQREREFFLFWSEQFPGSG